MIVVHNAAFDASFLREEFKRAGEEPPQDITPICTLRLAKRQYNFPSNELGNIARYLGIPLEREHRALWDALLLQKVFHHFVIDLGVKTVGELIELQGGEIRF